uniref:TM2 domain-containing protein n=1 Tax=Acrobeloides nanus TaxID=290746 RepID=A0A914EGA6_9BILA
MLPLANVAKARFWLGIGAIAGLHRLYLAQVNNAFIFLSTGGIFLFGPVYDLFYVNRLVHEYNDELVDNSIEKEDVANNSLDKSNKDNVAWFSLDSVYDLLAQIAYGMWLGLCLYFVLTFLILTSPAERLLFAFFLAIGVASGVYIAGNRGNKIRKLSYIWIERQLTISTSAKTKYILTVGSLVSDYIKGDTAELHRIFKENPQIQYMPYVRKPTWKKPPAKSTKNSAEWYSVIKSSFNWDLSIEDEKKFSREFDWVKFVTAFIVDYIRVNIRYLDRKANKSVEMEPLKWVSWRLFAISTFSADFFVNDRELTKICIQWMKDHNEAKQENSDKFKWQKISRKRACEIINSIFN